MTDHYVAIYAETADQYHYLFTKSELHSLMFEWALNIYNIHYTKNVQIFYTSLIHMELMITAIHKQDLR